MMDVVYATGTTTVVTPDGATVLVQHGDHWLADDPIVRANPGLFSRSPQYGLRWYGEPPDVMSQPPVEQTTAGPGEQREVRRRG